MIYAFINVLLRLGLCFGLFIRKFLSVKKPQIRSPFCAMTPIKYKLKIVQLTSYEICNLEVSKIINDE